MIDVIRASCLLVIAALVGCADMRGINAEQLVTFPGVERELHYVSVAKRGSKWNTRTGSQLKCRPACNSADFDAQTFHEYWSATGNKHQLVLMATDSVLEELQADAQYQQLWSMLFQVFEHEMERLMPGLPAGKFQLYLVPSEQSMAAEATALEQNMISMSFVFPLKTVNELRRKNDITSNESVEQPLPDNVLRILRGGQLSKIFAAVSHEWTHVFQYADDDYRKRFRHVDISQQVVTNELLANLVYWQIQAVLMRALMPNNVTPDEKNFSVNLPSVKEFPVRMVREAVLQSGADRSVSEAHRQNAGQYLAAANMAACLQSSYLRNDEDSMVRVRRYVQQALHSNHEFLRSYFLPADTCY